MTALERLDAESCYRAVKSRDRRFDGVFYTAVRTTGIYCRPSCPARTPSSSSIHAVTASPLAARGFRRAVRVERVGGHRLLPAAGCWEITGHLKGVELSFVVWVAA